MKADCSASEPPPGSNPQGSSRKPRKEPVGRGSLVQGAATRIYWRLPHDARRALFHLLWPGKVRDLEVMVTPDADGQYPLKPFDDLRCIFVHIPKTAGVSVTKTLFGGAVGTHTALRRYQVIYPRRTYDRYFKFAFVRNPWDRTLSTWRFLKKGGLYRADAEWAGRNLGNYSDFGDFVRGWLTPGNIMTWRHFVPQYRFIEGARGVHGLDFLGRFENLDADFARVAERLGFPEETRLPRENTSGAGLREPFAYRASYDEETAARVAECYHEDIRRFNYSF